MTRTRRWLLRLLLVLVLVEGLSRLCLLVLAKGAGMEYAPIVPDGLSEAGRRALDRYLETEDSYIVHDPELGWAIRPNASSGSGLYRSNGRGLRADRDHTAQARPGILRVLTFGDSFTHCDDVAFDESWQEQLSRLAPHLEVINAGVPGFGPDQALLRYRAIGRDYQPHVVILGFMSENISRVVNVFRPFYTAGGGFMLSKPRFVPEGDGLRLLPNPLTSLHDLERLRDGEPALFESMAEHDYWYGVMPHVGPLDFLGVVRLAKTTRYVLKRAFSSESIIDRRGVYRSGTEALQVAHGILAAFSKEALDHGALPIILLFPSVKDLGRTRGHGIRVYTPLIELLERDGDSLVVDLYDAFPGGAGGDGLGAAEGHYSAEANAIAARHLHGWLEQHGVASVEAVGSAVARERERLGGR